MAGQTFELNAVEHAQYLQLGLIDQTIAVNRLELAVGALELLSDEIAQLQEEEARFYIDSNYAIDRPQQETPAIKQKLIVFGQVAVEGNFSNFSYVQIGSLLSSRPPVSSLCLSLEKVNVLPDGTSLPDGDVLHLPVLAINQCLRAA